ncbi:MAG: hypothetical protein ACI4A5_03365 [Hominilimicola sp.]
MIPFGQGFKDMSPPTKELYSLVLKKKIIHNIHPVLKWNFDMKNTSSIQNERGVNGYLIYRPFLDK